MSVKVSKEFSVIGYLMAFVIIMILKLQQCNASFVAGFLKFMDHMSMKNVITITFSRHYSSGV